MDGNVRHFLEEFFRRFLLAKGTKHFLVENITQKYTGEQQQQQQQQQQQLFNEERRGRDLDAAQPQQQDRERDALERERERERARLAAFNRDKEYMDEQKRELEGQKLQF